MYAGVGSLVRKSALWAHKNHESRGGQVILHIRIYDGIVTASTSQLGKPLHGKPAIQTASS